MDTVRNEPLGRILCFDKTGRTGEIRKKKEDKTENKKRKKNRKKSEKKEVTREEGPKRQGSHDASLKDNRTAFDRGWDYWRGNGNGLRLMTDE